MPLFPPRIGLATEPEASLGASRERKRRAVLSDVSLSRTFSFEFIMSFYSCWIDREEASADLFSALSARAAIMSLVEMRHLINEILTSFTSSKVRYMHEDDGWPTCTVRIVSVSATHRPFSQRTGLVINMHSPLQN